MTRKDTTPAMTSNSRRSNVTMFTKTKWCKFNLVGKCSKGKQCNWAHSEAELSVTPDLSCTRMCKELLTKGFCNTPNCTYAHSSEDLRPQVHAPKATKATCAYDVKAPDLDCGASTSTEADECISMKVPSSVEDSNDSASISSRNSADFAQVRKPPGLGNDDDYDISYSLCRMEPAYVSVNPEFYAGVGFPEEDPLKKFLMTKAKSESGSLSASDFATGSTVCSLSNAILMSL